MIILNLFMLPELLFVTIISNESAQNRSAFRVVCDQSYHLCECDLLYFVRIHNVKQVWDNVVALLAQVLNYFNEFLFIDYAVAVSVFVLKAADQWFQQLFVVFQLEIEHAIEELGKLKLSYWFLVCQSCLLLSGQSSAGLLVLRFLVDVEQNVKLFENGVCILLVVKILDNIIGLFPGDFMVHFIVEDFIDLIGTFVRHFCFNMHFEEIGNSGFEFSLYKSNLFVNLISQNFAKHANVVVFS